MKFSAEADRDTEILRNIGTLLYSDAAQILWLFHGHPVVLKGRKISLYQRIRDVGVGREFIRAMCVHLAFARLHQRYIVNIRFIAAEEAKQVAAHASAVLKENAWVGWVETCLEKGVPLWGIRDVLTRTDELKGTKYSQEFADCLTARLNLETKPAAIRTRANESFAKVALVAQGHTNIPRRVLTYSSRFLCESFEVLTKAQQRGLVGQMLLASGLEASDGSPNSYRNLSRLVGNRVRKDPDRLQVKFERTQSMYMNAIRDI